MARLSKRKLRFLVAREWRSLVTINPSDRPWQMPIAAALASGIPLLVGAYFGHLASGLLGTLGGLVFLYLPTTPLHHRIATLLACSAALIASYALGLVAALAPLADIPILAVLAFVMTAACRFYRIGPPGPVFFIMAAAIAVYSPAALADIPFKVGLMAMGALLAVVIGIIYSLIILRLREPQPIVPLPPFRFGFVVVDPVIVGLAVGLSLAVAQALQLERPYWAPISCLAVIQGLSLRAVWTRQVHRLIGTTLGLLLAGALLTLPANPYLLALMVIGLTLVIENAVVRHYGFAVIFITPLAIFLAEAPTLGHAAVGPIMLARLEDTIVGCAVGLIGGLCLHRPRIRHAVARAVWRIYPMRLF